MSLVIEELPGLLPPHRLFARVKSRRRGFLLESALGAGGLGAYSFVGFDPFLTFRSKGDRVVLEDAGGEHRFHGDPLRELRRVLGHHACAGHPTLPFCGGAVGLLSYELGARWENVSRRHADDPGEWDIDLAFHNAILAFDHATSRWFVVAPELPGMKAEASARRLREQVLAAAAQPEPERSGESADPVAHDALERYLASVERIREYIRSGDIYQANLAHRFTAPWRSDPYELYLRLRERSPAPFASFVSTGEAQVVSCSPERFLQVRGDVVASRPIKGTRPRGATPELDQAMARELAGSAKERAELLMIVDLVRNDFGRVCRPGSIRVEDLYRIEAHPTVYHLVATVRGQLRADCDRLDLLKATFPGGSITGAPKIRAMQVIDEVETTRRHLYTGAIGYFGFDGGCDLAMAIRTLVCRSGLVSYHVGAGIVWDSDPRSEYEETLAKGRALRSALQGK